LDDLEIDTEVKARYDERLDLATEVGSAIGSRELDS